MNIIKAKNVFFFHFAVKIVGIFFSRTCFSQLYCQSVYCFQIHAIDAHEVKIDIDPSFIILFIYVVPIGKNCEKS